jgi:hypothetical protein
MTNCLIKNQLDRDARVGAGQQGREWFLLFDSFLFQNRKVLFVSRKTAGCESSIAVHQFLKRFVRCERALRKS